MLKQFIKQFTNQEIVKEFIKIDRSYFLTSDKIRQTTALIQTKPAFEGVILGTEGRVFKPSIFLLQKICAFTNKKINADKKGEWMFICGKDVFGKSVLKFGEGIKINDFVIVQNQYHECLGYGKITADISSKGKIVENFFDIGDFLRRER